MNIQRSVLVATPASASFITIDALQMFQGFYDDIHFKILNDTNGGITLCAVRENNHSVLEKRVEEEFPGRFRIQKVSAERLN